MNEYTFTNAHGDSLTFSGRTDPIMLEKITGLTEITGDQVAVKTYGADGAIYKRTDLQPKQITVYLYISGDGSARDVSRKFLNKVFNPKIGEGVLACNIGGVISRISAVPDGMPDIDMDEPEMLESVPFILLAHNPYFTREKQTVDFSYVAGGLHFPLAVTDTGSDVGYRVIEYIKIVENDGTKEAGCKAVFEAIGAVVNPVIQCLETNESLKVNYSMVAGERMVIDTSRDVHRIKSTIDGVTTDITGNMDFTTAFFDIPSGASTFVYSADSGAGNLNLTVEFTPRYISL